MSKGLHIRAEEWLFTRLFHTQLAWETDQCGYNFDYLWKHAYTDDHNGEVKGDWKK